MKLEVGKKYRARNGEVWEIIEKRSSKTFPFTAKRENRVIGVTEDGKYYTHAQIDEDDLIEEFIEQTTNLNLVEAYRAVKTGEWEFRRGSWDGWYDSKWFTEDRSDNWRISFLNEDDFEIRRIQKPLVLEEGKFYRLRNGRKAYIGWLPDQSLYPDLWFVMGGVVGGGWQHWGKDGKTEENDSDWDILALWEDDK